jgi:hypothetical protein
LRLVRDSCRPSRKSTMKRFVTIWQSVFRSKIIIVVATLIIPGLVGSSLILQSPQFAGTGNCASYTVGHTGTRSCASVTHHPDSQGVGQTNKKLDNTPFKAGLKKLSLLKNLPPSRGPVATSAINRRAALPIVISTPTPVPTSPPQPISSPQPPAGQGTVTAMIEQIFGSYAVGALHVANCESGLNPNAYNPSSNGGSHAEGVFQILYPSTWMGTSEASSSPYNAQANILAAHQIFVRDGYSWHEWSCAP